MYQIELKDKPIVRKDVVPTAYVFREAVPVDVEIVVGLDSKQKSEVHECKKELRQILSE